MSTEMSDTNYNIWCFIEGDNFPFPVIASSTTFIASLKCRIKEKRSIPLQGFDAGSLILWKVRFSDLLTLTLRVTPLQPMGVVPVKPSNTLATRIRDLGPDISQFARELDPADLVAFQNQNPTPLRLDVIIQVAASASVLGKRYRAADDWMLSDLLWLEEVHSKIWDRKGLKPQLFREVKVT
jgi:crinkler effector protein